jgi:hypothetical protein
MTDFIVYSKAVATSSAAIFVILFCVLGLSEAIKLTLSTIGFLVVTGGALALVTTFTFMFYDWKHRRNEESDSAKRTGLSAC